MERHAADIGLRVSGGGMARCAAAVGAAGSRGANRWRDPKAVSHAGLRRDKARTRRIDIHLLTECADCNPQHLQCVLVAALSPDFLGQSTLCQESAGIENEYFQ